MTKKEYQTYVNEKAPKSPKLINGIKAFVVGGLICIIGQLIYNFFISLGLLEEEVLSITTIIMIFLGAILTGMNIYDEIGKFAGAGSAVPITGFANSIVSPAMEFKSEGQIMGVGAKMFVIAGPVLVYGTITSVIIGIIYYFIRM